MSLFHETPQKLNVGIEKSATTIKKFKNAQLNAGLIKPKLNFIYAVATQEDTRDISAQNKFKVSDLLAEKKKWIQGLEKLLAKINEELIKVKIS